MKRIFIGLFFALLPLGWLVMQSRSLAPGRITGQLDVIIPLSIAFLAIPIALFAYLQKKEPWLKAAVVLFVTGEALFFFYRASEKQDDHLRVQQGHIKDNRAYLEQGEEILDCDDGSTVVFYRQRQHEKRLRRIMWVPRDLDSQASIICIEYETRDIYCRGLNRFEQQEATACHNTHYRSVRELADQVYQGEAVIDW